MVDRRRLAVNTSAVLLQVALSGIMLFLLYRFLVQTIGIEKLGVWSVVLATTLATAIGDFGLSGGVVRFVAKYQARDDHTQTSFVVQTAAVTIAILFAVILTAGYPLFRLLLKVILPSAGWADGFMLLPYALLSLWISSVGGVFQAGLDGMQRNAVRSVVTLCSNALLLLAAYALVPRAGLEGLARAQIIQNSFVLIVSWILIKRQIRSLPLLPYRWRRDSFVEMAKYGAGFQVMTIAQMLFDPITKALLARFGGLASTGYYEMANRMVMQLRALIVNANQVLVPVIANVHETAPERVKQLYLESTRVLLFFALPFYSGIIVLAPIVSRFWLGGFHSEFVFDASLLCVGWLCNTISGPAYFSNLGTGYLRWNVIGQITIGTVNAVLGFALGMVAGGQGVVVSWTIALAVGSFLIIVAHARTHGLALRQIPQAANLRMLLASIVAVAAALVVYKLLLPVGFGAAATASLAAFLLITTPFVWTDPVRPRLTGWLNREFNRIEHIEAVGPA